MKTKKPAMLTKSFLLCLAVLIVAAWLPASAFADTAANNIIRNTVTVSYADTDGTAQPAEIATVDVTVNLVAATPTLSAPTTQSTDPATGVTYNYTITSNAYGPDTYDLAVVSTTETTPGINSSGANLSSPSIVLGGSSVATAGNIAAAGTTAIVVPSDAAVNAPESVNGIETGDKVVINNQIFTVDSVDDSNGGNPGTSIITVTGNGTLTAIAIGDLIGEQGTFDLTVTPGVVDDNTVTPTITVVISAQDLVDAQPAATHETITTVNVANLDVTKVADPLTAAPGATITYTITVTNNGSSNATLATVTDPIPQFTSYVDNSTRLNGITVAGDGATSPLAGGLAVDDDVARTAGAVATGIIQPTNSAVITFQVTVD